MNTKLVVFDLGNVLFTFSVERAFDYWAAKTGENSRKLKSLFIHDEMYNLHEKGTISSSQYYEHVISMLELNISEKDFMDGWDSILLDPIIPSFEAARKIKDKGFLTAVLSNTNYPHTVILKEKYGYLFESFNGVFFSNEIGFRKPERESYMHVLDSLKINPEESLMIDDLKENIEGASDAGMKIIHLEDYTLLGKRLSTLL